MALLWIVIVVAFPVLVAAYFVLATAFCNRICDSGIEAYTDELYAVFLCCIGVIGLYIFPYNLHFGVYPQYALGIVVGVSLYWLNSRVWTNRQRRRPLPVDGPHVRTVISLMVIAVGEEILYRGFLVAALHEYGAVTYIGLSAVTFGMSHYREGRQEVAIKTVDGAVYAVAFLATGSIVTSMLAHLAYNAQAIRQGATGR